MSPSSLISLPLLSDWSWIQALVAFALGALAGSFAGVVITRLPRLIEWDEPQTETVLSPSTLNQTQSGQTELNATQLSETELPPTELGFTDSSIRAPNLAYPASHCLHCKKTLPPHHNIPLLSYAFLKGRCASCKNPIGKSLFAIELLCAIWWCICYLQYGQSGTALVFALFGSALLCLAFIDWQTQLLPDAITQPLLWAGLIASAWGLTHLHLNHSLWGAVLGYGSLWLVSRTYYLIKGQIGLGDGDLKLVGAIGAWMGPVALIALILIASLGGIVVALLMRLQGHLKSGDYIPFGPFLVFSALLIQILIKWFVIF